MLSLNLARLRQLKHERDNIVAHSQQSSLSPLRSAQSLGTIDSTDSVVSPPPIAKPIFVFDEVFDNSTEKSDFDPESLDHSYINEFDADSGSEKSDESNCTAKLSKEIETWTDTDTLYYGLLWVGYDAASQNKVGINRKLTRFREFYGPPPSTYAPLINDIREKNGAVNYKEFMMAVNWAHCRNRRAEMNVRWGVCEEYVYPKVFNSLRLIQDLKPEKISLDFSCKRRHLGGTLDTFSATVYEFRDVPSARHYDQKSAYFSPTEKLSISHCSLCTEI